jgi:hypothetical protein
MHRQNLDRRWPQLPFSGWGALLSRFRAPALAVAAVVVLGCVIGARPAIAEERFKGICMSSHQEAYPGVEISGHFELNRVDGWQWFWDRKRFWSKIETTIADLNAQAKPTDPRLRIWIAEPERRMIGTVGRALSTVAVCYPGDLHYCRNRNLWLDRRVGPIEAAEALIHAGLSASPSIPVCKYRG